MKSICGVISDCKGVLTVIRLLPLALEPSLHDFEVFRGHFTRLRLRWAVLDSHADPSCLHVTLEKLYLDVIVWLPLVKRLRLLMVPRFRWAAEH